MKANNTHYKKYQHIDDLLTVSYPHTAPITQAIYKQQWADFEVTEQLQIADSNNANHMGEHLWLWIKKQGMNSTHVATALAKWAKIPAKDVGYSGIKDRHAVTYQWFSIRLPSKLLPDSPFEFTDTLDDQAYAKALHWHWQNKKLKRGTHKHNHFQIILRQVQTNHTDTNITKHLNQHIEWIRTHGVPNYFGKQRFGHNGNTLTDAIDWLNSPSFDNLANPPFKEQSTKKRSAKQRDKQSLMLSALRSVIFNQILAERVRQGNWNKAVQGDVFNLAGSNSVFAPSRPSNDCDEHKNDTKQTDNAHNINQRLQYQDIHPTIPLWGQPKINNPYPSGQAQHIAQSVINANPTLAHIANSLQNSRINTALRPTRLIVSNLSWRWLDDDKHTLFLSFTLPKGSYASTVLATLVDNLIS